MAGAFGVPGSIGARGTSPRLAAQFARAARSLGPPLLFGVRLWASVSLALYVAYWLELDNPSWAGATAAIVCQPSLGASLRKGWYRMIGTLIGAMMIVVLTAFFAQDRGPFLIGLALWGGACALAATLLRNFAAYAAALAGYTAAIVASDTLGATGGSDGQVFLLAVYRASEICLGIVCAGVVLAGTDLGGAPRRLARLLATLSAEIARGFGETLALTGPGPDETQTIRRELTRRIIALDPVIDEASGESSRLRSHSPVLQRAVDGLFAAIAGWRAVALDLVWLPSDEARPEAEQVRRSLSEEMRSALAAGEPERWMTHPAGLRRVCDAAMRRLTALPAATPSLRLLADETAVVVSGLADALDGLAVLMYEPASPASRPGRHTLRIADALPALVNAARAFITIGAVSLFWIVSQWPNGAFAITFAAVVTLLLAPRAEQAYAAAVGFMAGSVLTVAAAAIIEFAVLPGREGFAALSFALALVLVPGAALMAQTRWPTVAVIAMAATMNFCPLLSPANAMSYDPQQFYNTALAILTGVGVATVAFRLIPPLSPAFRTRRLLALTLRDLRRLAVRGAPPTLERWADRVFARLVVLPNQAAPIERSRLLAALSVGKEIIQLRQLEADRGFGAALDEAFRALAQGRSATALAELQRLEERLAAPVEFGLRPPVALRAQARILALSALLTQHAAYFDAGAPA